MSDETLSPEWQAFQQAQARFRETRSDADARAMAAAWLRWHATYNPQPV